MKILFQAYGLSYRGGTNSLKDYAHYNETLLGNKSVIAFDQETLETTFSPESTIPSVLESFQNRFEVFTYSSEEELNEFASAFDLMYTQRSGLIESPQIETNTALHIVFKHYAPYAYKNACISDWLSDYLYEKCSNPETLKEVDCRQGKDIPIQHLPFVPYIVDLPAAQPDKVQELKDKLGIPKDNFVFGRHGGFYEFDLPFTKEAIIETLKTRNDITFVFLNTKQFYDHPNIKYLEATFDPQEKSNYIAMCDAMLHGRAMGETFGLAIAEFLFHNKPVMTWGGGGDRNHVKMLDHTGLCYTTQSVNQMILDVRDGKYSHHNFKQLVEQFTPINVMNKFNEVFLK
jgi:hypothetical protein